ncbi:MAG TPA: hypothetical protein DCE11_05645 [Ruminiclostridium sp.]|nr:hypothetical protein [Ruminiclostridium sp.]
MLMEKKTLKMTGKTAVIQIILFIALILSYTLLVSLVPLKSRVVQRSYAFVFLIAAAIYDIRTNEIPLSVCAGMISLALIYSVIYLWDIAALIAAVVITVLLLAVSLAGRGIIGTGDALLLGSSVMMLSVQEILGFLFLTFLLSSVLGVILSIKMCKFKDAVVPLAPCIAVAFIIRCLLR